jgi:hypothetical protein
VADDRIPEDCSLAERDLYITVQGIIQQEQSSPHQQGSLTPGVMRLIAADEEEEVAEEEEDEGVERAVVVVVVMTCLGILGDVWWLVVGRLSWVWRGWRGVSVAVVYMSL